MPTSISSWVVEDGRVTQVGHGRAQVRRCELCGGEFHPTSRHTESREQRYCSRACFSAVRSEHYRLAREARE